MNEIDLSMVHPDLIESARESWNEGDIGGLLCLVGHKERGDLLMANIKPLQSRGLYEIALADTYTHGPHFCPLQWRFLFTIADRQKLAACGHPIPQAPVMVYRGISCSRRKKWIRGLSWTTNPHTAAWFATRYSKPNTSPAVYAVRARPENILLMTNERAEEEVVLAAWKCGRLTRMDPMPAVVKPAH